MDDSFLFQTFIRMVEYIMGRRYEPKGLEKVMVMIYVSIMSINPTIKPSHLDTG